MNAPQPHPAPGLHAPPSPVRPRLASKDRRQQLLDRAIELFAKHGFNGTRTKDIAAACGVSEGILFRHFATKEDLYHAILDTHIAESGEWLAEMKRLAARRDDTGFVRCLVTQMMKSFRQNASFHRLMAYARLEGQTLADIFHERMGLPTFGFLCEYIAGRQRDGVFRAGDPGVMVLHLFAPALFYSQHKYIFGIDFFPQPDEEIAGALTELILNGLRAPRRRNRKAAGRD